MKKQAQIITSILFVSIVTKSFFKEVNYVDGIILLACTLVFCMYEYIKDTKERKELEEYKTKTDKHFAKLEEDLQNARNYMSKLTASQSLRR